MENILLTYAGPLLILSFLLITYIISAYEKIHNWNQTIADFKILFAETFVGKAVVFTVVVLLCLELIVASFAALAIWDILEFQNMDLAIYCCIMASILSLILLVGLRLIKDIKGASRVAIYFMVSALGLYWIQSIASMA